MGDTMVTFMATARVPLAGMPEPGTPATWAVTACCPRMGPTNPPTFDVGRESKTRNGATGVYSPPALGAA